MVFCCIKVSTWLKLAKFRTEKGRRINKIKAKNKRYFRVEGISLRNNFITTNHLFVVILTGCILPGKSE
jgi:hypothetical protein